MTPGINAARKAGIVHTVHEYTHDPASESYGLEAAEKLGVAPDRVFKTLVVNLDRKTLAVAILPVASLLSMKHVASALGAKKAAMAAPSDVERATGYVLGGVSPLGQKKRLTTVIDASVGDHTSVFVSGGRRGLEIELTPADLVDLTGAVLAEVCQ